MAARCQWLLAAALVLVVLATYHVSALSALRKARRAPVRFRIGDDKTDQNQIVMRSDLCPQPFVFAHFKQSSVLMLSYLNKPMMAFGVRKDIKRPQQLKASATNGTSNGTSQGSQPNGANSDSKDKPKFRQVLDFSEDDHDDLSFLEENVHATSTDRKRSRFQQRVMAPQNGTGDSTSGGGKSGNGSGSGKSGDGGNAKVNGTSGTGGGDGADKNSTSGNKTSNSNSSSSTKEDKPVVTETFASPKNATVKDLVLGDATLQTRVVQPDEVTFVVFPNGNLDVRGSARVSNKMPRNGVPQFALVAYDDFDKSSSEWSLEPRALWATKPRAVCGGESNDFFLGMFTDVLASKEYKISQQHQFVRIEARVHYFDKWQGELLVLEADGQPVWTGAHHYCPKIFASYSCHGVSVCGDDAVSDLLSRHVEVLIPHTAESIKLTFRSTLGKREIYEATWGIDDVMISVL